ncbi:Pseudouridine-5'-phosphatase [Podochytrium sp. JEL0797]|nr:Pseudouridine-5'-phosphatase [Podochytrium sp. JEL0797]
MLAPAPVTHVLFDMDGLLLDTERIYSEVTNEILSRFGHKFSWDIKSQMIGTKERDAANLLIKYYGIQNYTADDYLKERNAMHETRFPDCKPLPGVMRFVQHLKSNHIPICVATSSHRHAFDIKSSKNGELFGLFDGNITCGDDPHIQNGKPAPDLFLAGANQLGMKADATTDNSQCLVFEDAPSGVLAGLNAGMQVVWIPDQNLALDPEIVKRCARVLKSMEDFNPVEFGLPAYSS